MSLPEKLHRRLALPLPGIAAQRRMEADLGYGRHAGPAPIGARRAAVLLLLYPRDGQWHLVLTLRRADLPDHGGQVSFPGGELDYGESPRQAAVREFQEELGVEESPRLLGKLTDVFVFVSNFLVTPWVGWLPARPSWRPSENEVAAVLEMPLDALSDPARRGTLSIERRGLVFVAPCFNFQEFKIWGATSMMMSELAELLEE